MKKVTIKSFVRSLAEYFKLLIEEFIPSEEEVYQAPKITGTWIATGNSYANRWVFRKSGTVEKYYNNELYKIYNWSIREASDPLESDMRELVLANSNNPGTEIGFQVSVLTGEQLILVYSNGIDESKRVFARY